MATMCIIYSINFSPINETVQKKKKVFELVEFKIYGENKIIGGKIKYVFLNKYSNHKRIEIISYLLLFV